MCDGMKFVGAWLAAPGFVFDFLQRAGAWVVCRTVGPLFLCLTTQGDALGYYVSRRWRLGCPVPIRPHRFWKPVRSFKPSRQSAIAATVGRRWIRGIRGYGIKKASQGSKPARSSTVMLGATLSPGDLAGLEVLRG